MSVSIWRHVRADLRRILLGVPGIPDVAWELAPGKPYQPTVGVAYLRERIEKGSSETASLGDRGTTEEQGIYLIDLYWPRALAQVDGEDLADAIRLAFWHGRAVSSAGPDPITGRVTSSVARTAIPSDGWTIFPVRIAFFVRRLTRQGAA